MNKVKRRGNRFRLAMMFAGIVFFIMLITLFVIFAGILVLRKLGFSVAMEMLRMLLFAFALVSLGVGTVLAFFLSKVPLKPIRMVCNAADKIAEGDYSVRLQLKAPEEFVQLSESFNHMAEELGSVEMLRTDFINDFSHEFKTPIVSIRGFAKMLKRDDLSDEERTDYLDTIIKESDRLAVLSSNVLKLSKLEQQKIVTDKKDSMSVNRSVLSLHYFLINGKRNN